MFNGHSDEFQRRVGELIMAGRMAQPDEIADAMLFLCSAQAGYMTGPAGQRRWRVQRLVSRRGHRRKRLRDRAGMRAKKASIASGDGSGGRPAQGPLHEVRRRQQLPADARPQ